jgi:3'(2'), 5'-bisphosphate nucleotidase
VSREREREGVLAALLDATRAAADVVLRIYREEDLGVELKGPDDPVTRADREANAVLLEQLARSLPGVPVIAEESDPSTWEGARGAREALFVDPIDGTREFIAKNGEFAVMAAFAEEGVATIGVVLCPALARTYTGIVGVGASVLGEGGARGPRTPIRVSSVTDLSAARCAVSRTHRTPSVDAKLAALGCRELVPMGSAGVKGARLAEASLEVYAHPSGSVMKLWDAGAPDAIVTAAGGVFTDAEGRRFDYRGAYAQGSGTLAASPVLHAEALRRFAATAAAADDEKDA